MVKWRIYNDVMSKNYTVMASHFSFLPTVLSSCLPFPSLFSSHLFSSNFPKHSGYLRHASTPSISRGRRSLVADEERRWYTPHPDQWTFTESLKEIRFGGEIQVTMHTKIGRGEENRNWSGGRVDGKRGRTGEKGWGRGRQKRRIKAPGDNWRDVIAVRENGGQGIGMHCEKWNKHDK